MPSPPLPLSQVPPSPFFTPVDIIDLSSCWWHVTSTFTEALGTPGVAYLHSVYFPIPSPSPSPLVPWMPSVCKSLFSLCLFSPSIHPLLSVSLYGKRLGFSFNLRHTDSQSSQHHCGAFFQSCFWLFCQRWNSWMCPVMFMDVYVFSIPLITYLVLFQNHAVFISVDS